MPRLAKAARYAFPFLLLILARGSARAEVFVGADAGLSVLSEEGHAPPICCAERETWDAPGARIGGRVGYRFTGPFFVRLDAGLAAHYATTGDGRDLTLWSPDVGLMLGAQARWEKVAADFALGGGWRRFSGSVPSNLAGVPSYDIATSAPDLRASVVVHRALAGGHRLGVDLSVSKVMIEQHVVTLSAVYMWGAGSGS